MRVVTYQDCACVHNVLGPIPTEGLMAPILTEGLMACGGEFYLRCPGFERLERVCDFEPAIEAAKWKEKVQLDRSPNSKPGCRSWSSRGRADAIVSTGRQ